MSDCGSDDVDEANLPSATECDARCKEFASITGTDSALAMFYLQDRSWDLEKALNAYLESENATGETPRKKRKSNDMSQETTSLGSSSSSHQDQEYHRIRVLSWNIDGLDLGNRKTRTKAVCDIINKENPHVVLLQEVVPETLAILENKCVSYHMIPGGHDDYFTAMMLKVGDAEYEDHKITKFMGSRMMRNLLTVKCSVKGIKMHIMTSHLESTKDHHVERKKQLKTALQALQDIDSDRTGLLGGDLNLRDKEVSEIGGIPDGIYDIWEVTGKRQEAKFTWDMMRNDNLQFDKFKPRARFDRIYIKHTSPNMTLNPVYFELVGIERLSCQRFPSDHWGLLSHYNVISRVKD